MELLKDLKYVVSVYNTFTSKQLCIQLIAKNNDTDEFEVLFKGDKNSFNRFLNNIKSDNSIIINNHRISMIDFKNAILKIYTEKYDEEDD